MTKVDMDRSLTEKTDFVDKILQFKGLKPQKNDYLASIHKTSQVPNERNNNNNEFDENSPILSEATEAGIPESPRSSISTNSGGFPMVEDDIEMEVEEEEVLEENPTQTSENSSQIHVEER